MNLVNNRKQKITNLLIVVLYIAWGAVGLFYHEMWRDEFHSWLIASKSSSLSDLWSKVVYEGHPMGWYLVLYGAHKLSDSFVIMQVIHLLIATVCVILLLSKAPFPLWIKVLFVFGAILGYEYLVIARNYNQALLLMMITATMVVRKQALWKIILVLALMLQFNLFAAILSGAFFLAVIYDKYGFKIWKIEKADLLTSLIWLASAIFFLLTVLPPEDSYFSKNYNDGFLTALTGRIKINAKQLVYFINKGVFVDLINNFMMRLNLGFSNAWMYALAFIYLIVAAFSLKRSLLSIIFYVTGFVTIFLFFLLDFYSSVNDRHTMNVFLILFFSLWLYSRDNKLRLVHYVLIGIPSLIYFWTGLGHYWEDYRYEFSSAKRVALFVQKNYPDTPVVCYPDFTGESVSAYLDKDLFYIGKGGPGSYVIWKNGLCDDWGLVGADFLADNLHKTDVLKKSETDKVLILSPYVLSDSVIKHYKMVKVLDTKQNSPHESVEEYMGYLY